MLSYFLQADIADTVQSGVQTQVMSESLIDMAAKGGWLMIVLAVLSVIAIYIFGKKWWMIRQASKIDKEVHDIMTEAYAKTEEILRTHIDKLTRVAEALLEMETLDGDQFEALYSNTSTVEELETEQKRVNEERAEKERIEAEKKAAKEAEERRLAEEQLRDALEKGKRVAVMDEKGNITFRDASELRKEREANQKKGSED